MAFQVPNRFRIQRGPMASNDRHGNNGAFFITSLRRTFKKPIFCIASDGADWEHVSVSIGGIAAVRSPTWEEMSYIKGLFWGPEDAVMQLHPPQSDHINNHEYCLHLWRPISVDIPLPDPWLVGLKGKNPDDIKAMLRAQNAIP